MSALGQKQTSNSQPVISALPPKADIAGRQLDVCFVPQADIRDSLTSKHCPTCCLGRTFTMSNEDFVNHVEHTNSKLLWHWCEPWGGMQIGPGVGKPLLPSRLHR
jgi:hypothetical protein